MGDMNKKKEEYSSIINDELFRVAIDQSDISFIFFRVIYNIEGEIINLEYIYVNNSYEKLINQKSSSLLGKTLGQVYSRFDVRREEWYHIVKELIKNKTNMSYRYCDDYLKQCYQVKVIPFNKETILLQIADDTYEQ